ncbi:MAG: hypothetical protein K9N46_07070 [Candidatus Marinimicrobia bacterium]|nr:hypothetical protein [Candidatus Neomarinimicrobiota bacterium]MCF7880482.1 hypothetical protein [Candidatus Neomarinimicrobiota bacterium]
MLKKLSLGQKLTGFSILFGAMITVGTFIGWYAVQVIEKTTQEISYVEYPAANSITKAEIQILALQNELHRLFNTWESDEIHRVSVEIQETHIPNIRTTLHELENSSSDIVRRQAKQSVPQIREILTKIVPVEDIQTQIQRYSMVVDGQPEPIHQILESRIVNHHNWMKALKTAVSDRKNFAGELDPNQCQLGQFLLEFTTDNEEIRTLLTSIIDVHGELHTAAQPAATVGMSINTYQQRIEPIYKQIVSLLSEMTDLTKTKYQHENSNKLRVMADLNAGTGEATKTLNQHKKEIGEYIENVLASNRSLSSNTGKLLLIAGAIGLFLIGIMGWFLTGSITSPVKEAISQLSDGSMSVSGASTQIAETSQVVAEGSSKQAASLEQVSVSLEELNAMAQQNADGANQANTLAKETKETANRGNRTMIEMQEAIHEVRGSAEETSKIIKTIDEIAFQTNLLALNASVEAARAGEAGQGFAVVANEVRNLAQRASQAANSTSELLENSLENAERSVEIVKNMAAELNEMEERTIKVNELIGEISVASGEQRDGVREISAAVAQIDKVTQANTTEAEASSESAGQLNNEAESLLNIVQRLQTLVYGLKKANYNDGEARTSGPNNQHLRSKAHEYSSRDSARAKDSAEELIPFAGNAQKTSREFSEF